MPVIIAASTLVILSLVSCTPNQPPATPVIEVTDTSVYAGSEVSLFASSDDPDGDPLTWTWNASAGTLSATNQPSVIWTSPDVVDTSTFTLSLEVSDGKGGKASTDQLIIVYPKPEAGLEVIVGEKIKEDSTLFDGSSYGYYRRQMLYYGSEIKNSGNLIKLSLMPAMSGTGIFNNFAIYMIEVSRTELVSNFKKNYEGGSPEIVFYTPSLTYEATLDSWFDFDLSSSFSYDSTNNLLIEVIWDLNDNQVIRNWGFESSGVYRSTGSQFDDSEDGLPSEVLPYIRLTFEK